MSLQIFSRKQACLKTSSAETHFRVRGGEPVFPQDLRVLCPSRFSYRSQGSLKTSSTEMHFRARGDATVFPQDLRRPYISWFSPESMNFRMQKKFEIFKQTGGRFDWKFYRTKFVETLKEVEKLKEYIVVVTKKPPTCQIMRFPLCCINGSIESKHITLKSSNNTLLAMKLELHAEEFF